MRKWALNLLVLMTFIGFRAAYAEGLQCDQDQDFCVSENKRLTIGDEVAVVDEDGDVVAVGIVTGMNDRKRRINLLQKYGTILQGHKVVFMSEGREEFMSTHRIYTERKRMKVGASLGLMPMNIASEAVAYTGDAFAQLLWRDGMLLVGRGQFLTASGITSSNTNEFIDEEYSVFSLNFIGGIAYEFLRKGPVMFRPEAGLGLAYVDASSTGSGDAYPDALRKIGNGVNLVFKVSIDAVYVPMKVWQPFATVSFTQINEARGTLLAVGVMTASSTLGF